MLKKHLWWAAGLVAVGALLLAGAMSPARPATPGAASGRLVLSGEASPPSLAQTPPAAGAQTHMASPAAVYCTDLGYEYTILSPATGEMGRCTFPEGDSCDAWEFLEGRCGTDHSICARRGYLTAVRDDGADPFSRHYAVCVTGGGVMTGTVSDLANLTARSAQAGCRAAAPAAASAPAPSSLLSAPPAATTGEGPAAPPSFDWRNYGGDWTTSVKDQGGCGSCWAFAAVGASEAAHNIGAGSPTLDLDLSEQYLVSDCSSSGSCCGGWPSAALSFIGASGVPDEACMAYVDGAGCSCGSTCSSGCTYRTGGTCSDRTCSNRCSDWATRLTRIASWGWVQADRTAIRQALVDRGPLVVTMGVGSEFGGHWEGDVYRCTNDSDANHAVVVAGYDDAGQYWIVKNSWGTSWGSQGYFKVGYGECHIEQEVSYVVAAAAPVPHDAFTDAAPLGLLPAAAAQSTTGATTEPGEPQPSCGTTGSTVWFSYTAPAGQQLTADTAGSGFDTMLAVYTGAGLSALTQTACDDDSGPGLQSQVSFTASAGTTYWFQAGGHNGASGSLAFRLTGPLPVVSVTSPAGSENDGALDFTVSLDRASAQTVTVAYNTMNGSAAAGSDYLPAGGTVTFVPGDTSESVPVGLVDDALSEGDESFTLVLSNPANATIGTGTGVGTIRDDDRDTTPPVVTVPAPITAEAAGPGGTTVAFTATATDPPNPNPPVTCLPASGATFPLGTTTVTCTATDAAGNTGNAAFAITVRDTTPPTLTLPAPLTAEATGPAGATVLYSPSAADSVAPLAPPVTCLPASGATFPLGTTTVTCTATDAAGNARTGTFPVTVRDTTPPTLTLLGADLVVLPVGAPYTDAGAMAFDLVDGNLTAVVVRVNPVDPSTAATYLVTFNVADSHGNAASQVTRRVDIAYFCASLRATIAGTEGDDILAGTPRQDVIAGLGGDDSITGAGGDDVICGGPGNDLLNGGNGADRLFGGDGDDRLEGGRGSDLMEGGAGDDTLLPGKGHDQVSGGPGRDTVWYRGTPAGVTVDLAAGTVTGGDADTLQGIENAFGSAHADLLQGSSVANLLRGLDGNDRLEGRGGDDSLEGGPGGDDADGGSGSDACSAETRRLCEA